MLIVLDPIAYRIYSRPPDYSVVIKKEDAVEFLRSLEKVRKALNGPLPTR